MVPLARKNTALPAASETYVEEIVPELPRQAYLISPGDVHLAANNRCDALTEILLKTECRMLVLNGDFLETSSLSHLLKRLDRRERDLLRLIDRKRRAGMRVVYTRGNHDKDVHVLLKQVTALRKEGRFAHDANKLDVLEALSLIGNWEREELLSHEYRGVKFIHIHGDQWDHIVRGKRVARAIAKLGGFFWDILKRIDREKHTIANFTKRRVKSLTKIPRQVAAGAITLAKQHNAEYVFAGHTHEPLEFSLDGIRYVNAGGFDMYESGLVSIGMDGNVLLHRVHARRKKISLPRTRQVSRAYLSPRQEEAAIPSAYVPAAREYSLPEAG